MDKQFHYSIFPIQCDTGAKVWLSLAEIDSLEARPTNSYWVYTANGEVYSLDAFNFSALLTAWNNFKRIESAKTLIRLPDMQNYTVACNSAIRLDSHLNFLATQQDELEQLAGEGNVKK